jgi:prepilin-type N-terminal cleavage/methylation domain-containing protein
MKTRAFTLTELLITITLFSLLVIPIIKLFDLSARGNLKTKRAIIAATLASSRLEEYKYMGFSRLKEELDKRRSATGNYWWTMIENAPVEGYRYMRRITRIAYYPDPNPPMVNLSKPETMQAWQRIQIIVEVYWKEDPTKPEKKLSLFTIIGNKKAFGLP